MAHYNRVTLDDGRSSHRSAGVSAVQRRHAYRLVRIEEAEGMMAKALKKAQARRNARRKACEELRASQMRKNVKIDPVKAFRMPGSMTR
jgi:hypothetical protein